MAGSDLSTSNCHDVEKDSGVSTVPLYTPPHEQGLLLATRIGITLESFKRKDPGTQEAKHDLSTRHLRMIAVGGSIGAGLFVASGEALALGGPLALLIGFGVVGLMMYNVIYAIGELACLYPTTGSFYDYASRFISPSWGFAMAWNYCFQWAIVLPLELSVASLTMNFWDHGLSRSVTITIFLLVLVTVALFGALGYGEFEFVAALVKILALTIVVCSGFAFISGRGPADGKYATFQGTQTWSNPGALTNGFRGICTVFVPAALAFAGTELVGMAALETDRPVVSLPKAAKYVVYRIFLLYLVPLFVVGLLVAYNDERLLGGAASHSEASPFVIMFKNAGIDSLAHFINFVIILSVISVGSSGIYGATRTLRALADEGSAPKVFSYTDKAERPLIATVAVICFGFVAYLAEISSAHEIFNWLLATSSLSVIVTWASICMAHIRFRKAWKRSGRRKEDIPFRSTFGVWGSYFSLFTIGSLICVQFYNALSPVGEPPSAQHFFKNFLAIPVIGMTWLVGYLWRRGGWISLDQIDLYKGLNEEELRSAVAQRSAELAKMNPPQRMLNIVF